MSSYSLNLSEERTLVRLAEQEELRYKRVKQQQQQKMTKTSKKQKIADTNEQDDGNAHFLPATIKPKSN